MSLFVRGRVRLAATRDCFLFFLAQFSCEDKRDSSDHRPPYVLYLVDEDVLRFGQPSLSIQLVYTLSWAGRWVERPVLSETCRRPLLVLTIVLSTQRLKFGPLCMPGSERDPSERRSIFVLTLFKNIR